MVFDAEFGQVLDVSTGQSGTFHQHVSLLLSRRSGQVIDDMHLVDVGCKHVHLQEYKVSVSHESRIKPPQ